MSAHNISYSTELGRIDDILSQEESLISATNDIEAISTWLKEFQRSKNTFESYRLAAERFYLWITSKNKALRDVTREDIQDYQDFLENPQPREQWCGKKYYRTNTLWKPFVKELSVSSIRLQLKILTGLYNYLIDAGYLNRNPVRLIRIKPKILDKGIERFLTKEELDYIFNYIYAMPEEKYYQLFHKERALWVFSLLYFTGCRRDEVLKAKMNDFFIKRNQWWFRVTGKGSKYGEIPITQGLMSALLRYRNFLGLPQYPAPDETIPIIIGKKGYLQGIKSFTLHKLINTVCTNVAEEIDTVDSAAAFKLRHVSAHWLRHTSATHQVDSGIDIRIVKENLRHSNLETTMRYQHTESDKRHQETVEKFK